MSNERLEYLERVLSDIDKKIASKYSHFLDDAGLSKIKQEKNSVIEEIQQLKANNEA
jgi:hypothetical protein